MKKLLLVAAAAASLGGSLSTLAQAQDAPPPPSYPDSQPPPGMAGMSEHMDHPDGEWSLDRREEWLAGRIERAAEHGALSGNEEQRGHTELNAIRSEQARLLARDGERLSEADRSYIAHRIDELNSTLRWEGRNPPPPWMADR